MITSDPLVKAFNAKYKGKYEINHIIAEGNLGIVYRGSKYIVKDYPVAVAIKIGRLAYDLEAYYNYVTPAFLREAKAMADISSLHVVKSYGHGKFKHENILRYFVVMEFLKGHTLEEVIKSCVPADQMPIKMPPKELGDFNWIAECLSCVLKGLGDMHKKGIIHGDLKPSSLLLHNFYPQSVDIIDLGSATYEKDIERLKKLKRWTKKDKQEYGLYASTGWFSSPEQKLEEWASKDSDLWSIGMIAYLLLTARKGSAKFVSSVKKQNPKVPDLLNKFLLKALNKNIKKRYRSAGEMKKALDEFIETKKPMTFKEVENEIGN